MFLDEFLSEEIKLIKDKNLYRNLIVIDYPAALRVNIEGKEYLNLCSNNYLNYADNQSVKEAATEAINRYGIGSTGSRLITGTTPLHVELESKLAEFKGVEAAMFVSSGYIANVSTIAALIDEKDAVFSDELNHASIIDGIKLSGATKFIYKHNDLDNLANLLTAFRSKFKKAMIVTDSIFSMDGDRAILDKLVFLKEEYNCFMMIDEAHATGIIGEKGGGIAQLLNLTDKIEVHMGTLSKAVGVEGAYIAGSYELIEYLRHKSRGFVFSTAPSPAIAGAVIRALELISNDHAARNKLLTNIDYFKSRITALEEKSNIRLIPNDSPIFCLNVGDIKETLYFQQRMYNNHSIFVKAIRPPTVKTSRLRLCLNADLTKDDLDYITDALLSRL